MHQVLQKLKRFLATCVGILTDWVVFIAVVLVGGYATSWYLVEAGTTLTTERIGPWVAWTAQAKPNADPYTRAHFTKLGSIDLSSEHALTFVARTDDNNDAFDASCTYRVQSTPIAAHWWSVTLYDGNGRLIENPADRYGFTKDTIALTPSGEFTITLSRDVAQDNWLPFGRGANFVLLLRLLQPDISLLSEEDGGLDSVVLPTIKKGRCR